MYCHGGIFWAHGLRFVAQKQKLCFRKDLGSFQRNHRRSLDQDPLDRTGFFQDIPGIVCCDNALMLGNIGRADKLLWWKLINGLAILQKMGRGIHMRAVVGAHGKGREVIQAPFFHAGEKMRFRFWITGKDAAGEYLLRDIVDLHTYTPWESEILLGIPVL